MANEDQNFLTVKDLYIEYTSGKERIHAVNGVSLTMKKGATLGLVGETGAGKTTIAKAIMRILPDPPARFLGGEILLDGTDVMKLTEEEMLTYRGNKIAMIFQDPMTALNPLMTVGDQILEVIHLHDPKLKQKEAEAKAIEMLEMVGIPGERYHEYPFQFSGGMKQRVVIAMALVCNPELLLADEPTTALDVTIQAQVLDMIRELKEKYQTSMLLITHDLGVIGQNCDNVAVIYAGQIVESGTKRDIFKNPKHPYTVGLFNSLPSMSKSVKRLTPIAGMPTDPANLPTGCPFHPRCPKATEQCKSGVMPNVEVTEGHFCRCCNIE
jgi:peptide/nickel transport system ATP-binding protein